MIRRGLRIDDDSDTQVKEERVTLDANRKRDKFQRDMDDFLFGGPAKRKTNQKKVQQQKQVQTTVTIKQELTVIKTKQSQVRTIEQSSVIKKQEPSKKVTQQKSFSQTASRIQPGSTIQVSQKNSRVSTIKPNDSTISVQKSTVTETKTLGQKQKSLVFKDIQGSRPNYIRKLRYTSQNYDFSEQNQSKHKFIDVIRPFECFKSHFNKKNIMNFKDKQFPAIQSSLGYHLRNQAVSWKKCQQFCNHATLGKYIDPNDIKKGTFSSNKFLSTLSVLAQREENIKRLIQEQFINPNGCYFVRLFINSIWRYHVLDSYFPVENSINGGAMSYNDSESDLWVSLIQKAYAKAFNGYDVFTRPQPREYYFRDLTGAPTSNYMIDNPEIFNLIKKALQSKKIVAAVLKSNASDLGLNTNCTLTVLNTNKKGGLTLRYSWPLIQQKAGIPISKEGILDFSDVQMVQYISYITIVHVNRSFYTTTIQTRHEKQFYVAYKIIVKQNTNGFLTISQLDQRMFPRQSYQYEPARLLITKKKTENNTYEYVKGGFSHMSRNLDVQVQLTPGEYTVFAFINWKNNVYDFNLTFYGDKKLDFVKIPTIKNHNLISQSIQSYNLQYGKRSALGHCHQFISYHQETNMILITVTNTSNKNYVYSHDLRKINFQSLHLMNLTNNQDNRLQNLTKQELENYKQDALQNRKWQIEFKGGETFTWVISTSQNYDVNNFRNWGFR